jgi:hypothetical protein
MHGEFLVILRSCSLPLSISFLKQLEKPSATNKKRKEEWGSPCLRPLKGEKVCCRAPFILTEYLTDLTQAITLVIQWLSKPCLIRADSRKAQSTLS